jgi:hypothetical protein
VVKTSLSRYAAGREILKPYFPFLPSFDSTEVPAYHLDKFLTHAEGTADARKLHREQQGMDG